MSNKKDELFETFISEQETEVKNLQYSTEYARQCIMEKEVNYFHALNGSVDLPTYMSEETLKSLASLPPIPNKGKFQMAEVADKYVNENRDKLSDALLAMGKQELIMGGDQNIRITIDAETAKNMMVPLSGNSRELDNLLPKAKQITADALKKAVDSVQEKKTFCFMSSVPGAMDEKTYDQISRQLGLDRNTSVIYKAPLSNNEWMSIADELLDKGFKVKYVQVYNDAETSLKNAINHSISTPNKIFSEESHMVERFMASYQAQQDRAALVEAMFGDKLEYVGIDNSGNNLKKETLGYEAANKKFNYGINPSIFNNVLKHIDIKSNGIDDDIYPKYDFQKRACKNKLADIKQELLFACDILSLQSKQLASVATTTAQGVRGEVPGLYETDGEHLLVSEKRLIETLDMNNNPYVKEEGEFTFVERQFNQNPIQQFTGERVIRSSEDVAGIFKSLETASVENSFAVYIPKGGEKAVVQHISTGSYNLTPVMNSFILHSAHKVDAERVFFIHNHPSGKLETSPQDRSLWHHLNKSLEIFDIKLEDGIIINTKSGKYLTFSEDGESIKTMPKEVVQPMKYNIHEFNKLCFSKDYIPEKTEALTCSLSVAQFISSHRLGDRDKIGYLIVDNANKVMGNLYLAETEINKDNIKEISKEMVNNTIRFGGCKVIVYGRFEMDEKLSLSKHVKECSGNELTVLDIIKQTSKDYGTYISYMDEGKLMEQTTELKPTIGKVSSQNGMIQIDINCNALTRVPADVNGSVTLKAVQEGGKITLVERSDEKKSIFEVSIDKYKAIEAKGALKMDRDFSIKSRESDSLIGRRVTTEESPNAKKNEIKKKKTKGLGL